MRPHLPSRSTPGGDPGRSAAPRLPPRRWLLTLLLLLGTGVAPGCEGGADRAASAELLVFAASDLQPALPEVAEAWVAAGGAPLRLSFGSSGNLAAQIRNGAPADLYLAASAHHVDGLVARGVIDPESTRPYAVGRLVLIARDGLPVPTSLGALDGDLYRVVAIANPEHAPYGIAAREALTAAGLWAGVARRLVLAENVVHAFRLVETGSADAGLVALSLLPPGAERPALLVDAALHAPLRQTGGVIAGSPHRAEAGRLLDFLAGDTAQAVLRRFGFEPPR